MRLDFARPLILSVYLCMFFPQILSAQITFDSTQCKKPIEWLKTHCYACQDGNKQRPCEVESFDYLGRIGDEFYYYAVYRGNGSDGNAENYSSLHARSVTLFEGKNDSLFVRPVWGIGAGENAYSFDTPKLVKTKYGFIFHTYMYSGNGGWDQGEYYLQNNGKWITLDVPHWTNYFQFKIPKDYWFCRGSEIDLKTMTIEFNVYKSNDACCCPTGGSIYAELGIQINKIIIQEIDYSSNPNE